LSIGYNGLHATVVKDGLNLGQGKKGIQGDGNAACSNYRHEPSKTVRVIRLENGYPILFLEPRFFLEKTAHYINLAMKIGKKLLVLYRSVQSGKTFVVTYDSIAAER
jgi:hypothetical protein